MAAGGMTDADANGAETPKRTSSAPGEKGVGSVSATFPRTSLPPDVAVDSLWNQVREGLGSADGAGLADRLGLPAGSEDPVVARKLLHVLSVANLSRIGMHRRLTEGQRESSAADVPDMPRDASFVGALTANQGDEVSTIRDVPTLMAIVRGGGLRQRRAAVARIAALLHERRALSPELTREATTFLSTVRYPELAYDLLVARAKLSGGEGRRARAELDGLARTAADVVASLPAFWDGQLPSDPVDDLPGDQRALLLMGLRDAPDALAAHVSAILEGSGGVRQPHVRVELLTTVRYANDARLVPSLRMVLESGEPELVEEAARALASTEDPRVHPALVRVYERTHRDAALVAIAGALGQLGDFRGRAYVRSLFEVRDTHLLAGALDALGSVGTAEDAERVTQYVDDPDPTVVVAAVRALGRVADGRWLGHVVELAARAPRSVLRTELEDAVQAIRARMELRGEDADAVPVESGRMSMIPAAPPRASAWTRMKALGHFFLGRLWMFFGALGRASNRFDLAANARPAWSAPHVAVAMALERRREYARALVSFRRALEVDRASVERNPLVMPSLTRCFLRRAEQLRADGRTPIARGLLDEVLALDLRWAPGTLRFELARMHHRLRREDAR